MKRSLCFVLVLTFVAAATFAGGRSQGGSGGGVSKQPMRFYMPGAPSPEADMVNTAVNEALTRDGVDIDYQPNYIPWDQWVGKINLMLSTGDEFELLHIMEDYIPTSTYASRNHLAPLSALIRKEAPNLTGRFDKVLWDSATTKGEIYGVPAFWRDNSGDGEGDITIRKDKFDQYNIPYPQNTTEILSALTTLQQRWSAEDGVRRYVYEHTLNRPPVALHRTYDTWPYYVSLDGIFQVRQNGEANMYYETAEFQKDAEFMNALYTRDLIHPDILNLPADTIRTAKQDGNFLFCIMTGPASTYELDSRGANGEEIYLYKMALEKPMLMNLPLQNANGVPITTKHPEAGLKFLDWVYSSQENQDLLLYGFQGRHWQPVGTDQRINIKGADNIFYSFDTWMIELVTYHRFDIDDQTPQTNKDNWLRNIYPDRTEISPVVGFNFDSTPVRVEYANVTAEYTASILPIKAGVIPYRANFPAALAKMKAAGSDRVIAEYRRQLAEYTASKK
jgi:putative aldouronate transport system substrate-binding protein